MPARPSNVVLASGAATALLVLIGVVALRLSFGGVDLRYDGRGSGCHSLTDASEAAVDDAVRLPVLLLAVGIVLGSIVAAAATRPVLTDGLWGTLVVALFGSAIVGWAATAVGAGIGDGLVQFALGVGVVLAFAVLAVPLLIVHLSFRAQDRRRDPPTGSRPAAWAGAVAFVQVVVVPIAVLSSTSVGTISSC